MQEANSITPNVGMHPAAVIRRVIKGTQQLPPKDQLLLVLIQAFVNKSDGTAIPSVQALADHLGVSTRTVQRALIRLTAAGQLVSQQRPGTSTRYCVVASLSHVTPDSSAPRGDSSGVDPRQNEPVPLTNEAPTPDSVSVGVSTEGTTEVKEDLEGTSFVPQSQASPAAPPKQRQPLDEVEPVKPSGCRHHRGVPMKTCSECAYATMAPIKASVSVCEPPADRCRSHGWSPARSCPHCARESLAVVEPARPVVAAVRPSKPLVFRTPVGARVYSSLVA